MGRRATPKAGQAKTKRAAAHTPPKGDGAKVRVLEKRLAESLEREKATAEIVHEKDRALTQAHEQVTDALEQQTATGEILRVIAGSPNDTQPVFEAIVRNAVRLCDGVAGIVWRRDGDWLDLVASHNVSEERQARARSTGQRRGIDRGLLAGRAILDRVPVSIPDISRDPEYDPELARQTGAHGALSVPMLKDGVPIGAITVRRARVGAFPSKQIALLETFADQAVIAIENVRLFKELEARNRDLTTALDQQTATSDILRVISSSPTEVRPVFDAIIASAVKLCQAYSGILVRVEDGLIHRVTGISPRPEALESVRRTFPRPVDNTTTMGQAILERRTVQLPDAESPTGSPTVRNAARLIGFRSELTVPMLRDGEPIGAIAVTRRNPGPFSPDVIQLLQTFADQAVIAIENVRLFTELQASNRELTTALDTQTATSDILRVISSSQTDVQPVFDAIIRSAVRLLRGYSGALTRLEADRIALAAFTSGDAAPDSALSARFPQPLQSEAPGAQAVRDRVPINVADAQIDPRWSEGRINARLRGYRSLVAVPLLRHEEALGAIAVTRREPGGFSDDEIALLKTFADQAVIAIENARLLTELQEKNESLTQTHAEVTEALERQTAMSEILRVISSSPGDTQPVFDAIVRSAGRLCEAEFAAMVLRDGDILRLAASTYLEESLFASLWPMPIERGGLQKIVLQDGVTLTIADVESDPRVAEWARPLYRTFGIRSAIWTPMVRDGAVVGLISVFGSGVSAFTPTDVSILETFADQAVIAIGNARLLGELQARTSALARSVEQLTALGDVGRAVSSSLDLDTVLTTIVGRAVQLSGSDGGTIFEYDEDDEEFSPRATLNTDEGQSELLRTTRLRRGEGAVGQMAVTREPIQFPDISAEGAYEGRLRGALLEAGTRALLAIPLLHEDRLVGGLVVTRRMSGEFTAEVVEILRTFATQSALAIQNARLFREIEIKSRELQVASQHKSEFLANMSHELRTPLNAIIGYSELLEEEAGDLDGGRLVPDLQKIATAAKHQLSLINDILDLSKIEAGRMELEVTDFDLPSTIDNALTLVRERATRRGITLGGAIDDRVGVIRGDERKVKQVLLNLLSNALKFTPEGGRIDVRAGVQDGIAEVSVTDNGVGIAPEDQAAVFEEFRQVGAADKKVEGTGLGLALCRRFVELHGGRIWVKSQVGQGSTFTFTLPVRREG